MFFEICNALETELLDLALQFGQSGPGIRIFRSIQLDSSRSQIKWVYQRGGHREIAHDGLEFSLNPPKRNRNNDHENEDYCQYDL